MSINRGMEKEDVGTSLAVQWLRLCAPNVGGTGSIPGRGTKILRAAAKKQTNKKKTKICYIYTMEYYSAIKKNEIMPFAAMWIDLEIVILSEVRERQISYDITYMWNLKKGYKSTCLQNSRVTDIENKFRGFPGGAVVKNLPANARDMGLSPVLGLSHMLQRN